jgi:hypothetical protein
VVLGGLDALGLAAGGVVVVVPALLDEEDALAAGVVFAAVLAPVLGVSGRDAEVDRRTLDHHRRGLDDDRLGIDHRRWLRHRADVDPAVEPRVADRDGDAHVGGAGRAGQEHCSGNQRTELHRR